jgi:hypothetical protein
MSSSTLQPGKAGRYFRGEFTLVLASCDNQGHSLGLWSPVACFAQRHGHNSDRDATSVATIRNSFAYKFLVPILRLFIFGHSTLPPRQLPD